MPVVKLDPVIKAAPETVTLSPIIRKEEPAAGEESRPEPVTPEPVKIEPVKKEQPKTEPAKTAEPVETEPAIAITEEEPKVAAPAGAPAESKPETVPRITPAEAPPAGSLDADYRQALAEAPGEAARNRLRQLVVKHPEHRQTGEALIRIGEISLELDEPTEALMALKAAAQRGQERPDLLTRAQDALLDIKLNSGDIIGASRQYLSFANQDDALKDAPASQAARAFITMIDGHYTDAAVQWQTLAGKIQGQPDKSPSPALSQPVRATAAAAVLGQAICEELSGQSANARQSYERVLSDHPDSPEASLARDRLADLDRSILK